jgi:hypothetical protein
MWTTKLSPALFAGIAVCVLQHSGRVDGDVAVRVTQDGKDVCGRRGNGALDLHAFGHESILSGRQSLLRLFWVFSGGYTTAS